MLLNNTPMLSGIALLRLFPETGKKHQLRLHLSSVGCPIIHDRLYPELMPESPPDFAHPLQLVAQRLEFNDPVSGTNMDFVSSFTINI
jgi:tRNA pseudouridine32 synthase/23S rRNA pseudouridine746 synthase